MLQKDTNNYFLKNVKLSGYKSIIDVDVDFEDGLNIIIGKNAAGKTNFLEFLSKVLAFSFDDLLNFSSKISFESKSKLEIEASRKILRNGSSNSIKVKKTEVETVVSLNNSLVDTTDDFFKYDLGFFLRDKNVPVLSTFVKHGIPKVFYLIDSPFSYKSNSSEKLTSIIFDSQTPYFIKKTIAKIETLSIWDEEKIELNVGKVRDSLLEVFSGIDEIKNLLIKYSPIEDVRFNENFNIFLSEDWKNYSVNNLFVEFKILGSWHPFEHLSDGTKRLFYIISEIGAYGNFYNSKNSYGFNNVEDKRIILIEEPELGIHPHQLMKLMEFLKEQSKTKQIIVTSHSPITLDVLNEKELNKIIIAYANKESNGTKLRHLNKEEKAKALIYMQEDYLSDYWKYSDLEK